MGALTFDFDVKEKLNSEMLENNLTDFGWAQKQQALLSATILSRQGDHLEDTHEAPEPDAKVAPQVNNSVRWLGCKCALCC